MRRMVGPSGYVLGLEMVPQLAERSKPSIKRACPELASEEGKSWKVLHGNALNTGEYCPYLPKWLSAGPL